MSCVSLPSPAKLNLFLKVLGKRADGYHNLKTVFERISLCDELQFSLREDGRITLRCQHPHVPTGSRNLVVQAARQVQHRWGVRQGVDITIHKRIPVAAGLGGGSSNAATALRGLKRLWNLDMSDKDMIEMGKAIGSDVPFFLYDCPWAMGTGRGEHIQPLSMKTQLWHILIVPCIKMYSREVFKGFNLQLTKPTPDVRILIRSLKSQNIEEVRNSLVNDLESSILSIAPQLRNPRSILTEHLAGGVIFSGSGPAVFGVTASQSRAEEVKQHLRGRYKQVYVVGTA